MKRPRRLAAALALPVLAALGCSDFLNEPDTLRDPNNPTEATRDNLFVGVQVGQGGLLTGELARLIAIWMQQAAGTDRQYAGYGNYVYDEDILDFERFYSTGGLLDIRRIQAKADSVGDAKYSGVAKIFEALVIGTAADIWGDVPYSEALDPSIREPELDPQLEVYAALQTVLDSAIVQLQDNSPRSFGPSRDVDLFYGGVRASQTDFRPWIELAHTLKARLYMHTAEVNPDAYALALAQAEQGISSPDYDFRTYQSATTTEENLWYQFAVVQREGYISPGQFLVDLLKSRNDPRLEQYFSPNGAGEYVGARPGEDFEGKSSFSDERLDPAFRQPIVTWAENQLIIAEAAFRTGDEARALTALNAVRTENGLDPVSLSGTALFEAIMTEKYIALFQNIEVWSDYRRTCLPRLTPAAGASSIPARILYPLSERNVNPNIPAAGQQPARNANDPNACS